MLEHRLLKSVRPAEFYSADVRQSNNGEHPRWAHRPSACVPVAASRFRRAGIDFPIVFHGPAVDGILDEAHYQTKFGTSNPNLKAIAEMKRQGVAFFVCGQYLAAEKIDPKGLTPEVTLAADALLVLIHYQNKGYAVLSL